MITIIRYLLVCSSVLFVPYEYSKIRAIYSLKESSEQILIFENHDNSGGDGANGPEYIYAVGKVNGLNTRVQIAYTGYENAYYADSLDNLEMGDTVKVWYNEKTNCSFIRDFGESKQVEIQKRIDKNVIIFLVYISLLIIFEYLFRKEWRNRKLKSEFWF